jgi:hypothetical protein
MEYLSWDLLKSFLSTRYVGLQFLEDEAAYYLYAFDGNFSVKSKILKVVESAELTDFETNYKAAANKVIGQTDTDGANIVRLKAAKKGWHTEFHVVTFWTSNLNPTYNKNKAGDDLGFTTAKFYDSSGTLLTDNFTTCVKSVFTWEASYDFEVVGTKFYQKETPTNAVHMYVIGVPDIPAAYGGSVPFSNGGMDLSFIPPFSTVQLDGRVSKLMSYSATYHTNKFEITLKHAEGLGHGLMFIVDLFKQ